MSLTAVLFSSFVLSVTVLSARGFSPDCSNEACTLDLIPYCLVNGTTVSGMCDAKRAQCVDKVNVDDTFAACPQTNAGRFDCNNYNPLRCFKDAIPFCLSNGTTVIGSCSAKKAVCEDKLQVDETMKACNKMETRQGSKTMDDDDNSSVTFTINIFLLCTLVVMVIFF